MIPQAETVTISAVIGGRTTESVTLTAEQFEHAADFIAGQPDDAGKQLARDAEAEFAKFSEGGWGLAKLAAEAKAKKIKDWASIIAIPPRKSRRRVEEWASTYKWAEEQGVLAWRSELDFGWFEIARKAAQHLDASVVVELLDTFRQEKGATAESFEAELRDMMGSTEPDLPKQWRRWSAELYGQADAEQPTVADCLSGAAKLLAQAAERKANQKAAQA